MSVQLIPVTVHSPYLWRGSDRFLVRGVVYQYQDDCTSEVLGDPITDGSIPRLQHDVLILKELGVNTIFVYRIDNTKSHTQAMKILEAAGIYVLIKISTPQHGIRRNAPRKSYNIDTMTSFFQTIDMMASYPNTLSVLAVDDLINNADSEPCMPVVAAVVRDLKKYMVLMNKTLSQRILPIGYGAALTNARDRAIYDYFSSGDEAHCIDFWTCKYYAGTGQSSIDGSGLFDLASSINLDVYRSARVPVFFSEYSDSTHRPRFLHDTKALYSTGMTRVFSGGCAYEMWNGSNGYGLAQMLPREEETTVADHHPTQGQNPYKGSSSPQLRRAGAKVVETRSTALGPSLLFDDFINYRGSLDATKDVQPDTNRVYPSSEDSSGFAQTSCYQVLATEHQVPESCVDWGKLEERLKNGN